MPEVSRRAFLAGVSGSFAAVWLAAETRDLLAAGAHAARAGRQAPPPPFQFLTAAQGADIEAMSAQIIPTDETPGAREAHVVYFMDQALATYAKERREPVIKGLNDLHARSAKMFRGAKSFASLSDAQQIALLTALEKEKSPFFEEIRGATIAGMLASPEYGGNTNKIGWKMIGFDDRFSWGPPFGWYDRDVR
jgi:gluconate 2-dehydrogenase gamma chain